MSTTPGATLWTTWLRAILVALCLTAPAAAQEGPTTLQFSFSNPGARSLGFGGAFVALADDATAAFANPAGLVQLVRPEVSIEGRQWSYSTPFTAGGRVSGSPTGIGLDTVSGLRTAESDDDLSGVSFLSVVYPFKTWSLAVYRHQLAKFESLAVTDGLFAAFPGGGNSRFVDLRTATRFEIVTHGLAAGVRLSERVSFGVAAALHEHDIRVVTDAFAGDDGAGFFAPSPFAPELLDESATLASDDTYLGLNFGLRIRLRPRWNLGAVYRQGSKTEVEVSQRDGPQRVLEGTAFDRVQMPTVFGLGLAYRSPGDAFTASFEWDRVEYSDIVDSLDPRIFDRAGLGLDDADELRAGFEYAFLRSKPLVALRLGVWLDPDHRIRVTGEQSDPFGGAIFQPGDDELHVALGLGLAFSRFQLDLGVDLSDPVDTASLSAIYGF